MPGTNPSIAKSIKTGDFVTNYHDVGNGEPVFLIHGSGPGVTAYANWGKVIPRLSPTRRVIAPDMVGFGYTERPAGIVYNMDVWIKQAVDLMDALNIDKADLVGNSFGGALAMAMAIRYPKRIRKLVLMGSMGINFNISYGLDQVWGYQPSIQNMRKILNLFAFNQELLTDELAKIRYNASIEPGFQEAFSSMFPEPRQKYVKMMASDEEDIKNIKQPTLIIHGREDLVIPVSNSYKIFELIGNAQLHIFGQCGHWTQIEKTVPFCDLVESFLSE